MGDTYVAVICIVHKLKKDEDEFANPSGSFVFPNKYQSLVRSALGYPVLYYRARATRNGGAYFAVAVVDAICPHPTSKGKLIANVSEYSRLRRSVHFYEGGLTRERAFNGRLSRSIAVRPVREIPQAELEAVIEDSESIPLAEQDQSSPPNHMTSTGLSGFDDAVQASFLQGVGFRRYENIRRSCRLPLRMLVLRIYDGTCILTSACQPFERGRFEVQCCHIWPLGNGGPDIIQNIVPISGTFHNLFDEGLISLDDDFRILVKDAVNPALRGWLNESGYARLPVDPRFRPALPFIQYHRRFIYAAPS